MKNFLLCFIPLFVAMDPIGISPIYLNLTKNLSPNAKNGVLIQSVFTVLVLSLAFLFGGQAIFNFLGIQLADFQIAGGILLLIIAVFDLIHTTKEQRVPDDNIGVVPIGIPLIMGPAALTTLMMLGNQYPFPAVGGALGINLILMFAVLLFSERIARVFGEGAMKAISKIISLFLAAIGVMFIRVGIQTAFLQ